MVIKCCLNVMGEEMTYGSRRMPGIKKCWALLTKIFCSREVVNGLETFLKKMRMRMKVLKDD